MKQHRHPKNITCNNRDRQNIISTNMGAEVLEDTQTQPPRRVEDHKSLYIEMEKINKNKFTSHLKFSKKIGKRPKKKSVPFLPMKN